MIRRIAKMFFEEKKPLPIIPKIGVLEILPYEVNVLLADPEAKDGNVNLAELVIISQLIKQSKPEKLFEIGTFDGRTTLNMAKNSQESAKIFTLDLGENEIEKLSKTPHGDRKFIGKAKPGWRFENKPEAHKITQLFGDSAKFDFSKYANSINFLFIDGAHQYEYVLKDSDTALKIIAPGAIILWHDYNTSWPGVTQALNELYQNNPKFSNLRHIAGTSLVILRN